MPYGCYFREKSKNKKLWFNINSANRRKPANDERDLLCEQIKGTDNDNQGGNNNKPINPAFKAKRKALRRYFRGGKKFDHLYVATNNPNKDQQLARAGYKFEGIEGHLLHRSIGGAVPLYRFWNKKDHFYTTDKDEANGEPKKKKSFWGKVKSFFWGSKKPKPYKSEGITGYCFENKIDGATDQAELVALRRYKNKANGDHFYTTNENEIGTTKEGEEKKGYIDEGTECYVFKSNNAREMEGGAEEDEEDVKTFDEADDEIDLSDMDDMSNATRSADDEERGAVPSGQYRLENNKDALCFLDDEIQEKEECTKAARVLKLISDTDSVDEIESADMPQGCSLNLAEKKLMFNKGSAGKTSEAFQPICKGTDSSKRTLKTESKKLNQKVASKRHHMHKKLMKKTA